MKHVEYMCIHFIVSAQKTGIFFRLIKMYFAEVLRIFDPVLAEVAGSPFSDLYDLWIGPRGINNKASV